VISENNEFPSKTEGDGKPERHSGFEVLIRRIGEGSDEAVWELLDRYSANILRVVRRHLPAELRLKVDSVDIVQSVWKSLLRKGEGFDHIASVEQFIGYIAKVAQYKVFETHRHFTKCAQFDIRREVPLQRPKSSDEEVGDGLGDCIDPRCQDPGDALQARESWSLAMEKVGARGQRVVQLRLQGMTYQEIAEETGLSAITVRRTLASVLTSLTA
jgi:RNA polymerase sigma factor (sigma-70 family)